MGYLHIDNLYKNQMIMYFKECYALEKVHGTSAHIRFKNNGDGTHSVVYYSGGENHEKFKALFDEADLLARHAAMELDELTIYGEAYGGKQQGMSHTYGKELHFIVFDINIGGHWLEVDRAENFATKFGLEFVPYTRIPALLANLDAARDAPSQVAKRRGIVEDKIMEGVVLRPLVEFLLKNGNRVISKHKRDEFRETKTPRNVDAEKLKLLTDAQAVADEWVTQTRLEHVMDKLKAVLGKELEMSNIPDLIAAMHEDVKREGEGEIEWTKETDKAVGNATVKLFKKGMQDRLRTIV